MKAILMFLFYWIPFAVHAEDKPLLELEKLTTKNGKVYETVKVMSRTAGKAEIYHKSGLANIKFTDLPDDIVEKLGGYDAEAAEKAATAQKEKDKIVAKAQRKRLAELERNRREKREVEKNADKNANQIKNIVVKGRYYNDVWKKFSEQTLNVALTLDGRIHLSNTSIVNAIVAFDGKKLKPFIEALEKGKDWQLKAQKKQLEITKLIKSPVVYIGMSFFSSKKGKQTDIVLTLKHFENGYHVRNVDLYLDQKNVDLLIQRMKQIPLEYKKLKEADKALK